MIEIASVRLQCLDTSPHTYNKENEPIHKT